MIDTTILSAMCITTGLLSFSGANFVIASASSNYVETSINWFAGIVTTVAACICVGMVKHMANEKKHIPENVNLADLVTEARCHERVKNLERLMKMNNKMTALVLQANGLEIPKDEEE